MAQQFRPPRRQRDSVPSIDLVSPARERSGSENSGRAAPNEGLQPQARGSSGQSRRRRDDGLWPVDEESAFIDLMSCSGKRNWLNWQEM